jgi:hypothetical protein
VHNAWLILVLFFSHFVVAFITGNWDPKTQEPRYLLKEMPTPALRAIAGFEQGKLYSLPRCRVEPPKILKKQIFPFIESELENVWSAVQRDKKGIITAVCTLRRSIVGGSSWQE